MNLKAYFFETTYANILKPVLFKLDAERVHDSITFLGKHLGKIMITKSVIRKLFHYKNGVLQQNILGITFPNPVGLSEGFDKDANLVNILDDVGFGFMQVGSVTLKAYAGNAKPRLYRLPKSNGIVVNYGLKNIGVDNIIDKLKDFNNSNFPISVSVAKTNSKETVNTKDGINDYYECLKKLNKAGVGDFYTVNISCPNVFGGEPFTTPDRLNMLLTKLMSIKVKKPLFIKMPINLKWSEFNKLLIIIIKHKVQGVIIGNLTKVKDMNLIKDEIPNNIKGGISGKPTEKLSNELIGKTYRNYSDKLKIIGVGGIFSAEDAYQKIKLGASLVQLITGMIFNGPQLIGDINCGLARLLKKDGYKNISEAIGTSNN